MNTAMNTATVSSVSLDSGVHAASTRSNVGKRAGSRAVPEYQARTAVKLLAKAHQTVKRQRQDIRHTTALSLVRQFDTIYHGEVQVANMVQNQHLAKSIQEAGRREFSPSMRSRQHAPGSAWLRCHLPIRARSALVVVSSPRRACRSAGTPACTAARASIGTTTPRGASSGSGLGQSRRGEVA
jgi:hypothetical protein